MEPSNLFSIDTTTAICNKQNCLLCTWLSPSKNKLSDALSTICITSQNNQSRLNISITTTIYLINGNIQHCYLCTSTPLFLLSVEAVNLGLSNNDATIKSIFPYVLPHGLYSWLKPSMVCPIHNHHNYQLKGSQMFPKVHYCHDLIY